MELAVARAQMPSLLPGLVRFVPTAALLWPLLLACSSSGDIVPPAADSGPNPGDPDAAIDPLADSSMPDPDAVVPPDAEPPDAVPVSEFDVCATGAADYQTLTEAIADVPAGATLFVCAGVYAERLVINGKQLTLLGTSGAGSTFIDGGGAGTVIQVKQTLGSGVVIEGITVRNGDAGDGTGGGIRCVDSVLTVRDSALSGNQARTGAGMYGQGCTVAVSGTLVQNNEASKGGGLYLVDGAASIVNSQIRNNKSRNSGGGMYLQVDAVVEDSTIADNRADWTGGGIYVWEHTATIRGNVIRGNSSFNDGGGMYFHWGMPQIIDNRIEENATEDDGGGIRLFTSMGLVKNNLIQNNHAGDSGGGIRTSHLPTEFIDNIIRGNDASLGGGMDMDNDSGRVRGGEISGNDASSGGGISIGLAPWAGQVVEDVLITKNHAYRGGALYVFNNFQPVTLRRLRIIDNEGGKGGAIHVQRTNFTFSNSIMALNTAADHGGAILARRDSTWTDPCPCPPAVTVGVFDFDVFYANEADDLGGLLWKDSPYELRIQNSIMLDNTGPTTMTVVAAEPTPENPTPPVVPPIVRYSDIMPGGVYEGMADPTGHDGNIAANPMFVDATGGNFHLAGGSPAIDAADPALKDADASPADMGVYGGAGSM
jgi:hypothetical protein